MTSEQAWDRERERLRIKEQEREEKALRIQSDRHVRVVQHVLNDWILQIPY